MRDVATLPKAHLHIHLEAAVRRSTVVDLADEQGVEPPTLGHFTDFSGFVDDYLSVAGLISSEAVLRRVIDEAVEDASLDGAVAVELATTPTNYADVFGSAAAALAAILDAAATAAEKHGCWVGIIVAIERTAGAGLALENAELAAAHAGHGVTGLGLHAEERGFPARGFAEAFAIARRAGLLVVPHAGELVGPESVRESIDVLGADRVQHGIRALEDPDLIRTIVARGITLDVCPTSNALLGVVSSMAEHPLPALLAAGVRCSINADDPTLFGASLAQEYATARDVLGLSDALLAACARSSIEASAAPEAVRSAALVGIAGWLAAEEGAA